MDDFSDDETINWTLKSQNKTEQNDYDDEEPSINTMNKSVHNINLSKTLFGKNQNLD